MDREKHNLEETKVKGRQKRNVHRSNSALITGIEAKNLLKDLLKGRTKKPATIASINKRVY